MSGGAMILPLGPSRPDCRCEWEASPPNIACPVHRETTEEQGR